MSDLMFCCLGNGVTVCDRARKGSGGDYLIVAHIQPYGGISIADTRISDADCDAIDAQAISEARRFKKAFLSEEKRVLLQRFYDALSTRQMIACHKSGLSLWDWPKEDIYREYIKVVCENDKTRMPLSVPDLLTPDPGTFDPIALTSYTLEEFAAVFAPA